jgi:hypothetical protein
MKVISPALANATTKLITASSQKPSPQKIISSIVYVACWQAGSYRKTIHQK